MLVGIFQSLEFFVVLFVEAQGVPRSIELS